MFTIKIPRMLTTGAVILLSHLVTYKMYFMGDVSDYIIVFKKLQEKTMKKGKGLDGCPPEGGQAQYY